MKRKNNTSRTKRLEVGRRGVNEVLGTKVLSPFNADAITMRG